MEFVTVIMAAGKGTRMKSELPKVLFKACGKPMISWVIDACGNKNKPIVVVGHKKELVIEEIEGRASYVVQSEQKGTGHAVSMAMEHLKKNIDGYTIVLAGDMPLIKSDTIDKIKAMAIDGYDGIVLTAKVDNPYGYGRIIHDESGRFVEIVEEKDATDKQREINEINSSVYCIRTKLLVDCLSKIGCDNAAGEYYLTDVIKMLSSDYKIATLCTDFEECMGVNSKVQLAAACEVLRKRINTKHMENGAIIIDPNTTYIDDTVEIGADAVIYPNNILEGNTVIEAEAILLQGNRIADSFVGRKATVQASVLTQARVGEATTVGPFAYLRPNADIGANCRIGDFVEVKNSCIDDGTKVSHLTYVGDSDVGKGVNIGCGVVFVNYDGINKNRSIVEDNCFIGCNTNLISPVKLGHGAYVAAGTTVTDDVESGALCIGRSRQTVKTDWENKWKKERDK